MSEAQGGRAVRIELATSELEGGCYRAWADPGQVLTVLSLGSPHDVFARTVEPELEKLEGYTPDGAEGEAGPNGAPPLVARLVGCVHEIHTRLFHDNQNTARDPRWVELTCALAEEDRLYFLKGAPAYICLLRDGQAHPAGRVAGGAGEETGTRLGRVEELRVELTSLAVEPGDTVVLLASDPDLPPDLQAIRNLFQRTTDLKRACDGLVNLLGMQSQGACAVAFRFVPVGASAHAERSRVNPLEELAAEFEGTEFHLADLPAAGEPAAVVRSAVEADPFSADAWVSEPDPAEAAPRLIPAEPEVRPSSPEAVEPFHANAAPASVEERIAAANATDPWVLREQRELPRTRGWRRYWPAFLAIALVALVLFVALPRPDGGVTGWNRFGAGSGGGLGQVEVDSDPPAEAVLLNGERVADGTPARLDSVPAGDQRIGLDFGPSGVWETEVKVLSGQEVRIAPRLVGSIEIVAEDPVAGGQVWVQGHPKRQVPVRLDSLPVGWTRVFYEDAAVPLWDRLVLVKSERTTRIVVPNRKRTGAGLIKVEALLYQDREGLVESTGDSIWVDGVVEGRTPLDVSLPPGLHSIRVGTASTGYASEVMEVKTGSLRHLQAQLGRDHGIQLTHVSPGMVRLTGPVLLSLTVTGAAPGVALRPTLHMPDLGAGQRELPMAPLAGDDPAFVASLAPDLLPAGRELAYYFTVVGPDGGLLASDLYRLQIQGPRSGSSRTPSTGSNRPAAAAAETLETVAEPSSVGD